MNSPNKLKIVNDPIYGFITIPDGLIFNLIEHRYFQRMRRITQMGMTYLVYPGAHHTRFHHALGAMFLMIKAVQTLRMKGVEISAEEEEGLCIAILLHDIGHGPFSHAMENCIVENVSHEAISLLFMEELNRHFNNRLKLAITIFKNEYKRKFLHQLIASQLDMDRMDYLRRDSFYTGVAEGNINSQRLIAMLNVHNDALVVEEKGVYSVEKFLIARQFMYWQVYLHKTGVVAEQLLVKVLKRAKELLLKGEKLHASDALLFFLQHSITVEDFSKDVLDTFAKLDDFDIVSAMKSWTGSKDFVLRNLSEMLLERKLLKVKLKNKPFSKERISEKIDTLIEKHTITKAEASYFVFSGEISNQAYNMEKNAIQILTKGGKIIDVAAANDQMNIKALSKNVVKYYLCYPKSKY